MRKPSPVAQRRRRLLASLLASALAFAPASAGAEAEPAALSIPLVGVLRAAAPITAGETPPQQIITVPAAAAAASARERAPKQPSAPAEPAHAAPAAPPPPIAALWPLDASRVADSAVTLRGEADSLDFSLFVPPGAAPSELTVAAVSSAFMLPRTSVLRAYVGEELLGERSLESITGIETLRLPVQPGLLKPGFNRVRIESDLTHRLYCGAEASYDLWTKLDLAQSGVAVGSAAGDGPAVFLAVASVARGRGAPIVIRSAGGHEPTLEQIQAISRQLGRVMGGGLRFATEASADASEILPPPVVELRASGTAGATFRRELDGRQVLAVRTDGPALPVLFADAPVAQALPDLPLVATDKPVPLSMLGFSTARVTDHLWSREVGFRLPEDWLIDVKDRAVLRLDFAYVRGLPVQAELRIRVNGDVVRLIPLDRARPMDAAPLEVRFDAGNLQAGRNELAFEVSLPGDPADQPCVGSDDPRIEIRETSTLTIPSSPRMHMPGLSTWMSSGGGLSIGFASGPAGTGDLALLHELTAGLTPGGTDEAGTPTRQLTVLRSGDLSRAAFGEFGIGRHVLLAALQPPSERRPGPEDASALPAPEIAETGPLGSATAAIEARVGAALRFFRRLALPDPVRELAEWLDGARAQAVLLQLDPASPDAAYLVLSDGADAEAVARALAGTLRHGAPLDGHFALLGWDGAWSTWSDPARLPVLQEQLSERNWRGVVGNFASARPRLFVGSLFAVALCSVLVANSYIAASRSSR